MSGYYVKPPDDPVGPGNAMFADIAEEYPAIAGVLAGRPKSHEAGELKPQTLMFFFDAGRLKFCLSNRHSTDVAFGVVKDHTRILESTEAALKAGEYEWKVRRR